MLLLRRIAEFVVWKLISSRFVVKGKAKFTVGSRSVYSVVSMYSTSVRHRDNSQSLGYQRTTRHRCINMWSWTLTVPYRPRARSVWIPLRMSTEICRLGEGTVCANLNAYYLFENLCKQIFAKSDAQVPETANLLMQISRYVVLYTHRQKLSNTKCFRRHWFGSCRREYLGNRNQIFWILL